MTILVTLLFLRWPAAHALQLDLEELRGFVQAFKQDRRGPFKGIHWFCPDGSVLPPKERCPQPGGIQHALHKDVVQTLATEHHLFLGQILAGTPLADFQDVEHNYSRLKQYQVEKFLHAAADGWIMRRARYYRGAYQAEDEAAWSERFLHHLLAQDAVIRSHFFLARQITKDLPRDGTDDRATQIRALAKTIADSLPRFTDIRVKIHGSPDETDLDRVVRFRRQYRQRMPPTIATKMDQLAQDLALAYTGATIESLSAYLEPFPEETPVGRPLARLLTIPDTSRNGATHDATDGSSFKREATLLAELLWTIRSHMLSEKAPKRRLLLMDLLNNAETVLFRHIEEWRPRTPHALVQKTRVLAEALTGCGFFEIWEWQELESTLESHATADSVSVETFLDLVATINRSVEWGTRMIRAVYGREVDRFTGFERLAHGFFDDRVRSSILLAYGRVANELSRLSDQRSGLSVTLFDVLKRGQVRGLNPGFARGVLRVVRGSVGAMEFSQDKIYALQSPPSDLKPVAGILTVSEGNAVSHVQLLARNLGIPNAAISVQTLRELSKYDGKTVFFAVSHRGSVIMKLDSAMSAQERALVADGKRTAERVAVPTDRLDLKQTDILSLSELRAKDSGSVCGPKAANLGQLSAMFPGKVVPGLVIPFGIFRQHMEQMVPGTRNSYWQFLQQTFRKAEIERKNGAPEREVRAHIVGRLEKLRNAIHHIGFLPGFVDTLRARFRHEFEVEMGALAIFIRSDTNMEDLSEFTGAGLNLTTFNIRDEQTILQSIRQVWASPFTERSFRWRQRYLLNPENVYPSLLLLPSVNVDKSGVMITSGVVTSSPDDILVAMNWCGGGAVEGQAAETYLLKASGEDLLLFPAREPWCNYLPEEGGVAKKPVQFDLPILSQTERQQLRAFAREVRRVLPGTPGIETDGPFDIELGFRGEEIYLFQVRPFVENKLARSSAYLNALDRELDLTRLIALDEVLN